MMNWGQSIIVALVVFACFVGTMAYKMATAKVDLVRTNYYQKEIDFQQQINRESNSETFNATKLITYSLATKMVHIVFPTKVIKGDVLFFRPSDDNLDVIVPIQGTSYFEYSTQKLIKGRWKVQATWTDGKQEYYLEDELMLR